MPYKKCHKLICKNCNLEFIGHIKQSFCSVSCSEKGRRKPKECENFKIEGNTVLIPVGKEMFSKIDKEDHETIKELRKTWYASYRKTSKSYYVFRQINGKTTPIHRVILRLNSNDSRVVNHKNFDTLDNRKENLEVCTRSENTRYHRKHIRKGNVPKSKYNGVSYFSRSKNKKWRSRIYVNGKSINIGYFSTEKEAAIAWNEQAKIHFGNFAFFNQID